MKVFTKRPDNELALLVKKGNKEAFTELYNRYWTVLFLHARKMLKDDEEAKDVVQELFVHLWNRADTLDLNSSIAAYLYKAVRNKIYNLIAHKRVVNDYQQSLISFLEEGELITEELVREKELALIIEQEIQLLPPKMREVFELSRRQHLSYKEIGAKMGISDHTVKRQVSNALSILRTKLGVSTGLIFLLLCK
ncbi:RNA polymerase sigma factor [Pedobacter psychroterrae]|uniref:RNA polymerase sigma-70 factor n=1 Tax=Pedobacter psychroterrae TaxID=2530453 RepID=A0A4R0NIW3_9SPHI|nr:RNA polymerase sigma-70 factor [Pedobacter psychroterrae]TCD00159.1 RNA polymerase sigma-70 factor [Pedobacter psychroterrae]